MSDGNGPLSPNRGAQRLAELLCAALFCGAALGCSSGGDGSPAGPQEPVATADVEGVAFADSALAEAVKTAVGKRDGVLTAADVAGVTELDASDRGISDLTGIERLTRLAALALRDNQIDEIDPLSALVELVLLDLDNNRITDISPLAALRNLETLILDNNQITDVSPLVGLDSLEGGGLGWEPAGERGAVNSGTEGAGGGGGLRGAGRWWRRCRCRRRHPRNGGSSSWCFGSECTCWPRESPNRF